jgi:hypothetical protein
MSTAIPVHVALVDDTGEVGPADLAALAGALSEQIQHDFVPAWKVAATVGAYPTAPAGTWAVHVQKKLDQPGALGYHTDTNNQPISYVEYTADYPVTVSHETLEMLADPFGNRLHSAGLPQGLADKYEQFGLKSSQTRVRYLLEVCDPCEQTSYPVGGINLSDFLLPYWYRTSPAPKPAYSEAGGCTLPRQVADGGYVSFCNELDDWFQVFNEGGQLQVKPLGHFDSSRYGSLREWTDEHAREHRAGA